MYIYLFCSLRITTCSIEGYLIFITYILSLRFTILIEEWVGKDQYTVSLHNLKHVKEDIVRFGHPDNYWCCVYEQAVKKYISIEHNHKNAEKLSS